eukprot:scaffold115953_cov51-Attheya_sp.AAC.2
MIRICLHALDSPKSDACATAQAILLFDIGCDSPHVTPKRLLRGFFHVFFDPPSKDGVAPCFLEHLIEFIGIEAILFDNFFGLEGKGFTDGPYLGR